MKVTLTPAQAEEIEYLEVDTLDAESSPLRHAFVAAFRAGRRFSKGLVVDLEGDALRHAASDIGAFGNSADILHDQGRTVLARSMEAHQRAAQQALKASEPRTTTVPASPTAEQRVAETQTGDAPMTTAQPPIRTGSEALLVYPEGDADTVTVVGMSHSHVVVRLPSGKEIATVHEDLGLGVDDDLTFVLDDGCTTFDHKENR